MLTVRGAARFTDAGRRRDFRRAEGAVVADFDAWAEYYDVIHCGLAGERAFYVKVARSCGARALELGCGTGRIAIPIAASGVRVTGLDVSPKMLDVCRRKSNGRTTGNGSLSLVCADMRSFDLDGRFDVVLAPYRTLMHLLTDGDRRGCFDCVRNHLAPSGTFVFNVWRPALGDGLYRRRHSTYNFRNTGRKLFHFHAHWREMRSDSVYDEHLLREFDENGAALRSVFLPMVRRWISEERLKTLLSESGLRIERLFGGFDGRPLDERCTEMVAVVRRAR